MKKLTLVVSCTDRKSLRPHPEQQARHLPVESVANRARLWTARIKRAGERRRLEHLYQGETWTQVLALANDAGHRGYDVRLLVASAGLGLRDTSYSAPGYSATFSASPDCVVHVRADSRAWWAALHQQPDVDCPGELLKGRVLFVLSDSYATALEADLHQVASRGQEVMLIGGTREVDWLPHLPADRALRRALGGSTTSLNLRMARRWLAMADGRRIYTRAMLQAWRGWAAQHQHREVYDRRVISDDDVMEFIRAAREADNSISKTRALRQLRDSGFACEQSRFSTLFRQEVAT